MAWLQVLFGETAGEVAHVACSLPAQTIYLRDEEREPHETPLRYLLLIALNVYIDI